ncbi:MAG: tetratricopeptide repeat protein [Rhodocyclaceae bacterium]|nr:tetratricopeptide repeat protein [Rhodocyclaceae bacterium]
MGAHSCDVTAENFQAEVIDASRQVPVVVDFWADWCQPCRVLKPILEKLAAEFAGRFRLVKIDSDRNPELAAQFGVRGIPAVKAVVDGRLVDEFTGALPESQVREFLARILPSPAEPLRLRAFAAWDHGDPDGARALLQEAIAADPGLEAAQLDLAELDLETGDQEQARALLEGMADRVRDRERHDALTARLALAAAGGGEDAQALAAELESRPADLDLRLRLANALAMAGDYRSALAHLLEIVRRDRQWKDAAGRKAMLNLFNLLGPQPQHENLVREFRVALARTLN